MNATRFPLPATRRYVVASCYRAPWLSTSLRLEAGSGKLSAKRESGSRKLASEAGSGKLEAGSGKLTDNPHMHKIAVIAGDGIGKEVIPAALEVIDAAASGLLEMTEFPWGCDYYLRTGRMMDADGVRPAAEVRRDLPRRDRRPARAGPRLGVGADPAAPPALRSVREPAADAAAAGHHVAAGGPQRRRTSTWSACARTPRASTAASAAGCTSARRTKSPSRPASSRATASSASLRYAFELAAKRPRKHARERDEVERAAALDGAVGRGRRGGGEGLSRRSSGASTTSTRSPRGWSRIPQTLDVIVASNLFGDILTDIGAAISGSLGVAPGANINPERTFPSMFEPIHGSAPDIAGKGIANPIGAIWAGALMLVDLGHTRGARPHRRARSSACSATADRARRIWAGRRRRKKSRGRSGTRCSSFQLPAPSFAASRSQLRAELALSGSWQLVSVA